MTNEFLGFMRPDGHAGARNTLLILPINRSLNFIATNVCRMIRGAVHFEIPAETGRPAKDRETIARVMEGLIRNPNVGGTLLLAVKPSGESAYRNMSDSRFAAAAEQSGKPFRILYLTESGGSYGLLGKALQAARSLAVEVSRARRSPCPLSALTLAVKCGTSDATSGIAGNPTVGNAFDRLIDAGGTAMFSETTEIIGAETSKNWLHVLSKAATAVRNSPSLLSSATVMSQLQSRSLWPGTCPSVLTSQFGRSSVLQTRCLPLCLCSLSPHGSEKKTERHSWSPSRCTSCLPLPSALLVSSFMPTLARTG